MVDFSNTYGSYFVLSYAIINYLSYMTVLAFIPACFMWGIAIILPHRQLLMVFGILAASFCAFMLIIDAQVYSMFRFHLNSAILHMIFNEHALDIFDLSSLELLEFGLIFFFFIVFEAFLAYFVWNKIIVTQRLMIGKTLALLWFGGFLFSYFSLILSITHGNNLLSQQNPNLPFFNQFIAYIIPNTNAGAILIRTSETHFSQPIFPRTPINYPLHSLQCAKKIKPYNIIFILVDSLRFDSLSEKNMPKLNEFSLENWRFFNHFSGGNATQPGLFSLFYSIPSSYWTAALEQKKRPAFLNILDKYNYKTRIIWSSQMQYPPFDKTIYLGLKHLHNNSSIGEDIGSWDRRTTELAINFLNKNKRERPFFLNLFYNAPHAFCSNQSFPSIYPLPTKTCSRIMLTNSMDPKPLYHRYLNAVHFIDDEISNVLNVSAICFGEALLSYR